MAKLIWGTAGDRLYETGIDHGILFLQDGTAVPWNGLVSVAETPSGGDLKTFYLDGIKYLNLSATEDFAGIITAFSAPEEFAVCDGVGSFGKGLSYTQQPRQNFNLVYRTLIGNDTDGTDYGYKLHLVYNALAGPATRTNTSLTKDPTANQLAWAIDTVPEVMTGVKSTAHLIIDSTKTDPWLLAAFEDILLGTEFVDPVLMSGQDVINYFTDWRTLTITDNGDGSWTATGPDVLFFIDGMGYFEITWPSAIPIDADSFTISSL